MNETMHTAPGPEDDETLEQFQALFQRWRESRRSGTTIPED